MPDEPRFSFVIATYNRRDVILSTLRRVCDLRFRPGETEVIVVDNASTDGTAQAIAEQFPAVKLHALTTNLGSCAKALGAEQATGRYVVFLDDDSYPRPGSVQEMARKFDADEKLAAAGFTVHLPDGALECSALPDVFIGCGVGFRRATLAAVGGLDATLFMQAEEYDLSFRLIQAGWKVATFPDLHVEHLKSPQARICERTVYYDTRNNLILTARYLPEPYEAVYRADWMQRYRWIAAEAGHRVAYWRGRLAGTRQRVQQRERYAQWRLSADAFERLFRLRYIHDNMMVLQEKGVRRIVLAGLGKNIYPFVVSARAVGLTITGIADSRFAAPRRRYRGIPIRHIEYALMDNPHAIVVSNTSPVHATVTAERLDADTRVPIHRWFGYDMGHAAVVRKSTPTAPPLLSGAACEVG